MPRHPRLFVPGATYHVFCRVARGEFVFDDPFEAEEFVDAARRIFDLDGVKALAWCLMGNHYHLVIETCTAQQLVELFEGCSGHSREDFASPLRTQRLIEGRIELTLLAISHYGVRSRDIADLIDNHPSSMTRWLNQGIARERDDAVFREHIDRLDRQISAAARNNEASRRVPP